MKTQTVYIVMTPNSDYDDERYSIDSDTGEPHKVFDMLDDAERERDAANIAFFRAFSDIALGEFHAFDDLLAGRVSESMLDTLKQIDPTQKSVHELEAFRLHKALSDDQMRKILKALDWNYTYVKPVQMQSDPLRMALAHELPKKRRNGKATHTR